VFLLLIVISSSFLFIRSYQQKKTYTYDSDSRLKYNETSGEFLDEPLETAGETAEVT